MRLARSNLREAKAPDQRDPLPGRVIPRQIRPRRDLCLTTSTASVQDSGLHSSPPLPQKHISHQLPLPDSLNVCCQVPVSALQAFRGESQPRPCSNARVTRPTSSSSRLVSLHLPLLCVFVVWTSFTPQRLLFRDIPKTDTKDPHSLTTIPKSQSLLVWTTGSSRPRRSRFVTKKLHEQPTGETHAGTPRLGS